MYLLAPARTLLSPYNLDLLVVSFIAWALLFHQVPTMGTRAHGVRRGVFTGVAVEYISHTADCTAPVGVHAPGGRDDLCTYQVNLLITVS